MLTNNGVIIRTGGRVRGGSGTVIVNAALWLDEVDQAINDDYGGVSTFLNTGTFRKTTTTSTTSFDSILLNNSGLVDTESGTINIAGGGTNSGTFNVASGTVTSFAGAYTLTTAAPLPEPGPPL
jgi:hypothetical protein